MPESYFTGLTGLIKLTKEQYDAIKHDPKTKYIVQNGNDVKEYLGDILIASGGFNPVADSFFIVMETAASGQIVNMQDPDPDPVKITIQKLDGSGDPDGTASEFTDLSDAAAFLKEHSSDNYQLVIGEESGIENIPSGTFKDVKNLVGITGNSVKTVALNAFSSCSALKTAKLPSVTFIGNYAFFGCGMLLSANFQDLESIGTGAFNQCASLMTVEAPLLAAIPAYAFYNCTSLSVMDMSEVTAVGNSAFLGCFNLSSEVRLMVSITQGISAFQNCYKLTKVVIPDGVTGLPKNVLTGCSSIREIEIPSSVQSIGEYAFADCEQLEKVSLAEGLLYLSDYAFQNNTALKSITLPSTIANNGIAAHVFDGCTNLAKITVKRSQEGIYNAPWGAENAEIEWIN